MQERSRQIPEKVVKAKDGIRMTEESQIWIPTKELQLRICVIAHSGCAGHRGVEPTTEAIAKKFWWPDMKTDIKKFVSERVSR